MSISVQIGLIEPAITGYSVAAGFAVVLGVLIIVFTSISLKAKCKKDSTWKPKYPRLFRYSIPGLQGWVGGICLGFLYRSDMSEIYHSINEKVESINPYVNTSFQSYFELTEKLTQKALPDFINITKQSIQNDTIKMNVIHVVDDLSSLLKTIDSKLKDLENKKNTIRIETVIENNIISEETRKIVSMILAACVGIHILINSFLCCCCWYFRSFRLSIFQLIIMCVLFAIYTIMTVYIATSSPIKYTCKAEVDYQKCRSYSLNCTDDSYNFFNYQNFQKELVSVDQTMKELSSFVTDLKNSESVVGMQVVTEYISEDVNLLLDAKNVVKTGFKCSALFFLHQEIDDYSWHLLKTCCFLASASLISCYIFAIWWWGWLDHLLQTTEKKVTRDFIAIFNKER